VERVEGGVAEAVLVAELVGQDLVAAAALVPGDDIRDQERALDDRAELVADLDVLPEAGLGAADLLFRVQLVDGADLVLSVLVALDGEVLRALDRGLALGPHLDEVPDRDQLAALVEADHPVPLNDRLAAEVADLL